MKPHEYQRSRSLFDLGPNISDSIFLNFFSKITTKPIEAKFHMESPCDGEGGGEYLFKWSRSHDRDDQHAHVW